MDIFFRKEAFVRVVGSSLGGRLPENTYRHDDFVEMPGAKGKGKAAPAKALRTWREDRWSLMSFFQSGFVGMSWWYSARIFVQEVLLGG